jgi:phosphocarrier protein HPr
MGTSENGPKRKARFRIVNRLGLHARAAAALVKTASRYQCDVVLCKDGDEVNGKSIMGVLMLAAAKGSEIEVVAQGSDAEACLGALGALIADKFGEEE